MITRNSLCTLALSLGVSLFSTTTSAQTLPAGVSVTGGAEIYTAGFYQPSGYWRDRTNDTRTFLTLTYDGQKAGTIPFGFELSGSWRDTQSYKSGAFVRGGTNTTVYATVYYDSAYGRFSFGRTRPVLLDYLDTVPRTLSAIGVDAIGYGNSDVATLLHRSSQPYSGSGSDSRYLSLRYDSPSVNLGGGQLRFGLEDMQLLSAQRGFPAGTSIVSAALQYRNNALTLGANVMRASQASSANWPQTSYGASARYDTGKWYASARYAKSWINNFDILHMAGGYKATDNLDLQLQLANYIHADGSNPTRRWLTASAKYTFDKGFYVGASYTHDVSGPASSTPGYESTAIYAGWTFDIGS